MKSNATEELKKKKTIHKRVEESQPCRLHGLRLLSCPCIDINKERIRNAADSSSLKPMRIAMPSVTSSLDISLKMKGDAARCNRNSLPTFLF